MRKLKDILDKGLDKKWQLTEEESSSLWESISQSLPSSAPKKGGYLYWTGAAAAVAAAVVAGFFLFKSPSSDPTPFQPENTPIEKTTTLAEGNGANSAIEVKQEKDAQNPVLAYAAKPAAKGRQGISEADSPSVSKPEEAPSAVAEVPSEKEDVSVPSEKEAVSEPSQTETVSEPSQKEVASKPSESTSVLKKNTSSRKSRRDYSDNPAFGRRFSLSASSNFSQRSKMDGSSNPMVKALAEKTSYVMYSHAPVIEQVSGVSYSLPLNFGIGVNYKINHYFSVGSGITYSYIHSKYDGRVNMTNYSIKQSVHYVGIPLNLYVNLGSAGNLDFYAATGGTIEKGFKANYQMTSFNGKTTSSDGTVKGVQFSVRASAGMEYRFGQSKSVGIYLEPAMVYYFDSKIPASIRTDQPLQIEAQAGVRFHLK